MSQEENITIVKDKPVPCVVCGKETFMLQKFFYYAMVNHELSLVNLRLGLCNECYVKDEVRE